jgi:3-hexulose-6-phosphate synthase/6-phospho-3-hexuloisomerase
MTPLLDRCRAIATSTWSDALDVLGVSGVMQDLALRSGSGRVAGTALTVKETVGAFGSESTEAFAVGRFLDVIGAGDLLVVEMGGAAISTFGGLAAQASVSRGAAGVVIDGGCRDVDDIRASGLWLSSRHVTPISGKRRVNVDAINVPVRMCGVVVDPGDYIVGDETGVVRVPAGIVEEALRLAEDLAGRDRTFAESLSTGEHFTDIVKRVKYV